MGRARTTLLCLTSALALSLLAAPLAHASSSFDRIFRAYQQAGKIDPCAFSDAQLQQASKDVPNDIEAYAPDFPNALQAAIEARAGGACKGGASASATPGASGTPGVGGTAGTPGATAAPAGPAPAGSTVTPGPTPEPTAAPAASDQAIARSARLVRDSNAGAPAPVVALGVLGALLVLGGLVYALARWLAWDPRWGRTARHALGEAGWRAGNTWSEFTDWVRLGR
jgi:hypothetical protein